MYTKFFDVVKTNTYFGDLQESIQTYETFANEHLLDVDNVVMTNTWMGEDAEAAKQSLTTMETTILEEIIQLQKDFNDLDAEILDKFISGVDSAANACVVYRTIYDDNEFFREKYLPYKTKAKEAEDEVSSLQSSYSKYGTISNIDFSEGHKAFVSICGGELDTQGYFNDCMKKLVDYNSDALSYIEEKNFDDKIDSLNRQMCWSVHCRHPEWGLGQYLNDIDAFDAAYEDIRVTCITNKAVEEWTIDEITFLANYYKDAVKTGDANNVQHLLNELLITDCLGINIEVEGARYDCYRSYLDPQKCEMILFFMAGMGYKDTDAFTQFEELSTVRIESNVKKGDHCADPNISILCTEKDYGISVSWTSYNMGLLDSYHTVIYKRDGLTNQEKYDLVEDDPYLEEYRKVLRVQKNLDRVKELEDSYMLDKDHADGAYDENLVNENNYSVYRYINDEDYRASMTAAFGDLYADDGYVYLTQHQKDVYNYLYYQDSINGTETAQEYLDLLTPTLRYKAAQEVYKSMQDQEGDSSLTKFCNWCERSGYEIYVGLDEIGTGIENYFDLNDDVDGVAMTTIEEYVDQEIMANASGGESVWYSVCKTTGAMAPGAVITVATGGTGGVAMVANMAVYGTSAGGQAKASAEQQGYTQEQAQAYGNAVALEEAAKIAVMSQVLAGGEGSVLSDVSAPMRVAGNGMNVAGIEFFDEVVVRPGVRMSTLDDRDAYRDVDLLQALENSFFAGGVAMAISGVQEYSTYRANKSASNQTTAKTNYENEGFYDGDAMYEMLVEKYGAEKVEWTSRDTLSYGDRLRVKSWGENAPTDEMYIKYKSVYQNDLYYNQATGEILWPIDDGFAEIPYDTVLPKGTIIDRYGSDFGTYTSPEGTPYEQRALAPGTELKPYSKFEILEDVPVKEGEIAPWFDQPGGGQQYIMPDTIDELIEQGVLRRIPAEEYVNNNGSPLNNVEVANNTSVDYTEKTYSLLPGEGKIGTYSELVKSGRRGDNITPHHMPSAEYMTKQGVAKKDGLCMNMEMPSPGAGGRHRLTDTYGRNMTDAQKAYYYSLSPREALAYDIINLRNIYQSQGLYSEIRPQLQKYIVKYKIYMPELFEK